MKQTCSVQFRDNSARYVENVEVDVPTNCPHCGRIMSPRFFSGGSLAKSIDSKKDIGLLFQCSFEDCHKFYALQYHTDNNSSFILVPFTYSPPIKIELPENIEKVSSNFVEIFSQATVAESENLNQIAGVGYRKSAEFLIKDYAIMKHPEDANKIKKMFLGKVIDEYLGDFPKIQSLAKAIAWIGNDETHYERRHTDKDINDLKRFIKSSSSFIIADYDADEALKFTSPNSTEGD